MNDKEIISMTAHMEGQSVIVKNLGRKRKVSEMELVCLCNFARLGLFYIFSELDREEGKQAKQIIEEIKTAIRQTFSDDKCDGLTRLSQSCCAIINQPRFEKYIIDSLNNTGAGGK